MFRIVQAPRNDKTATPFVIGDPYRRVRLDSIGFYIMEKGTRRYV